MRACNQSGEFPSGSLFPFSCLWVTCSDQPAWLDDAVLPELCAGSSALWAQIWLGSTNAWFCFLLCVSQAEEENSGKKPQEKPKESEKSKDSGKVTITKVFDFAGEEVR